MVEMGTYYFIIEQVLSEAQNKHQSYQFVIPLPKGSPCLAPTNPANPGLRRGFVSSMIEEKSLELIMKGKFGPFERDREEFKKIAFTTFDMTHFGVQILIEEAFRKFEEFHCVKLLTSAVKNRANLKKGLIRSTQ